MKRRSPSLPKSIYKSRAFLRRPLRRRVALLSLALVSLTGYVRAANTEYDVNRNSGSNLDLTSTYTVGGTAGTGAGGTTAPTNPPSVTSDVTFDSGAAYTTMAFTLPTSITFGSLDDLSATAIAISNTGGTAASVLTLGGSGDLGDGVPGSSSADLLFVGTGASLTLTGGSGVTALGLALGQSGNFDIVGTASISSIISGTGFGITKTGAGTLTLSGANTFSGGLTDTAGTVAASSVAALGTGAFGLGASSGTAGALLLYSGGSNFSVANTINVNAGSSGTLEIEATSGAPTLTGLVTLSNNLLLVNTNSAGGNSLNLSGGISGTGNVTFSATSAGGSVISGTALTFTGTLSNTSTGGAGFGVTANMSGAESFLQNSVNSITTLSGTNTNTGTDTAAVGTLEFAKEVSLFNQTTPGTLTATTSNLIVQAGATAAFQVGNTGGFTAADIAALSALGTSTGGFENGSRIGIDTAAANFTDATAITNSNSGANSIGLTKLGNNTLTLTGTNTYTGATIITTGTLQLGLGTTGNDGSIGNSPSVANSGTLAFNLFGAQTYAGSIGGGGGLTKAGAGTLTLSGVNTFTNVTSVGTGGTLDLANSLALENSTVGINGTGAITFDSAVTSNAFVFGGVGTAANNSFVLQNTAGNAITLQIGNPTASANSTTSGVFSGAGSLTLSGFNNTITLTGANTYTGTTTVTGGTLNLGGATAAGSISASSALVLGGAASGGTLAYTQVSGTATETQTFASTTINAGENFITTSTAYQTLNLGAITGNVGGTVDINPNTTSAVTTATTANVNGILGGYATYGGKTTWAVAPATSGGAITGLAAGSYTPSATAGTTPANYAGANVDVTASETLTGAINPNSLRFNTSTNYTLTLTGLNTITSGGILVTPAGTGAGTITGGILTGSASGQLAISIGGTAQTASLNLSSLIVDNGGATAVTVSAQDPNVTGAAPGSVSFNNASNSYSGGTFLNGGGSVGFANGGTPFGTGTLTLGNQFGSKVSYGNLSLNNNAFTTGLLASAVGTNNNNGQIGANGGGTVTLIGAPGASATYNGSLGTVGTGRTPNVTLDGGTEIFGALNKAGGFAFNNITANGGTLQLGNGFSGTANDAVTKVVLGGGTFAEVGNVAGFYSQTFTNGLAVNAGGSTLTVNSNGGAGTVFSPGAFTRNAGGTVNFILPTAQGGAQTATNGITTTTVNTNGIIGGYATVGGTDWATNATNTAGGNIVAYTGYTADTFSAGTNTNVTTSDAFAAGSTNSIRFNTAGANVVTQTGTGIVTSGGILVTANVGANALSITGGTLEGASGADLVIIQNDATAGNGLTIGSIIANNVAATGLTKSGAGLLTLTGTNTYTGGTFLNGGVLNAATANINGSSTTNGITFNGGTLQAATGGITTGKAVVIGATGGTVDTNGNAVTLSGVVSGTPSAGAGALGGFNSTGAFAFTKAGAGTLTLSNIANTFGGGLVINNGTVADGSVSGAGTFGTGYVTFGTSNTPTMSLGSHSVTVAGLIGSGSNGIVTGGVTGTPVITLNGVSTQTFGGVIQNGSATSVGLTMNLSNPTESQILTNVNTYTGTTTITAGTLQLGNGATGNDGSLASASIVNNSALVYNTFGSTSTAGVISGTGTLTKLGAGTVTLTKADTYTGTTTITAGTLQLGNGATGNDGSLASASIVNNSALVYNTFGSTSTAGVISGTGTLTKLGAGTVTLSGANTYSGRTTISGGTLAASGTGTNKALGGTTSIAVNNSGTLLLGAANQVNAAAPVTMGTSATQTPASTSGILSAAAGANQGSAETLTAGTAANGPTVAGMGALTLNNSSTLNYAGSGTTLVFGVFTANNGSVLNVTGYTNTSATADGLNSGNSGTTTTDDRLVFNNGGGADAPLTSFDFGSGPGVGVFEVNLDNGFYEVAVPEPSTWLGGVLLVGTAAWQYRRRSRKAMS